MKKKIIMGLFVLTAVIGMGFAASYYACGCVKNRNGNESGNVYYKCKKCTEQDANYADRFKKNKMRFVRNLMINSQLRTIMTTIVKLIGKIIITLTIITLTN